MRHAVPPQARAPGRKPCRQRAPGCFKCLGQGGWPGACHIRRPADPEHGYGLQIHDRLIRSRGLRGTTRLGSRRWAEQPSPYAKRVRRLPNRSNQALLFKIKYKNDEHHLFESCSFVVLLLFFRFLSLFASCSFIRDSLFLERFFTVPGRAFSAWTGAATGHTGQTLLWLHAGPRAA